MEAALGTAEGTLQREWYLTRALDACVVGAAALLVVDFVCSGSFRLDVGGWCDSGRMQQRG